MTFYRMMMFWIVTNLFAQNAKAGIPGIKIKTSTLPEDTSEFHDIYAVVGSEAYLPCSLSQQSSDDDIILVLWYRIDHPNPIYTLDIRSNSAEAKHYSNKLLTSRAYFNMSQRYSAHLRINPIREDDEGMYRCRIDYKRGRTTNRMIKITVIVPVKSVTIRDEGNTTYSGVIGPFSEGQKLTLICETNGGRPSPQIVWRKGLQILNCSIIKDYHGVIANELTFESLKREDLLSSIMCEATNNNITDPVFSSVTIDLNLRPVNVKITSRLEVLAVGELVELSCQSEGSRPPANISWSRGSESITALHRVYEHLSVSHIQFKTTADDNGKKVICKAENTHLPESALMESLILNVEFAPKLSLVFGANVQYEYIREGSDVYFECNVQANPEVKEVQWKYQSQMIYHTPLSGIMMRNHSLLLHNVSKRNKGLYQCQAENIIGKERSEEVYLRIQHSPVCVSRQLSTYGIARQGKSNISCSVEADPSKVTFTWTFNGSVRRELLGGSVHRTMQGAKSIIEYHPVTVTDYGVIHCHARNAIGAMAKPCVFNIVPSGPPPALQNCTIYNITHDTMYVTCNPYDSLFQESYFIEIYRTEGKQLIKNISTVEEPKFYVTNLPTESNLVIAMYAISFKGRSESVVLTATTKMKSENIMDAGRRYTINFFILSSLIFLGILTVLTLITGIIMLTGNKKNIFRKGPEIEADVAHKISTPDKQILQHPKSAIYITKDTNNENPPNLAYKISSDLIYKNFDENDEKLFENMSHKNHAIT